MYKNQQIKQIYFKFDILIKLLTNLLEQNSTSIFIFWFAPMIPLHGENLIS